MDEAEIKRIIEQQGKSMSASMEKLIKDLKKAGISESEVKRLNQALKEEVKSLKLRSDAEEKAVKKIDELTKAVEDQIKASKSFNENLYKMYKTLGFTETKAQQFADGTQKATQIIGKFGKTAYEGSGKISDYTSVFKDAGFAGYVVADLGQRLQSNIDVFRTLSNVGASFGQNLVTLRETAASAGLPLEDFSKLVGQNSERLAALYGSTTQGAMQFSRLSEQFRRTNIEVLAPLGFTVSDVNDVLLTNLELQRRSGTFVEGANQQQIDSARTLALELDRLSKLTGQNRRELLKTMESQLTNERFLAFLGSQTAETGQRLQAFSASVGKLAPGLAEGFQDLIANAGVPVTAASRALIQNIPEATSIINQLTSGTLTSSEAMVQLRDAAQRSNQSLRGVAQTGTVEFARLFGEVNKLAKAKLDEAAVTEEQVAKQNKLTAAVTQFESVSKELSASFQSIETGFFATMGSIIGNGTSGINKGLMGLAGIVKDMNPVMKAILFSTKTVGSYFLDKGGQILTNAAGVALGIKMSGGGLGGGPGGAGGVGGTLKKAGRTAGLAGLGLTGLGIGTAMAASSESDAGKMIGIGTSAASGALLGSMIAPGIGTAIGGVLGAIAGMASLPSPEKRATGTMGEIGLPFEPKTSNLQVHAGERVLNPTEARDYAGGNEALLSQYSQLNSQMTQYNLTAKEMLQLQKENNKAVSTLVAVNMATEKNTKKTSKMVDKVGPSLV